MAAFSAENYDRCRSSTDRHRGRRLGAPVRVQHRLGTRFHHTDASSGPRFEHTNTDGGSHLKDCR